MPKNKKASSPAPATPFKPRAGRPSRAPKVKPLVAMERVYRMHDLLGAGRPVTKPMLAKEFGVDEITVWRDMEFMRDRLKAPIAWSEADESFRYTRPYTTLARLELTPAESAAFRMACSVSPAWRSGLGRQLRSAVKKVAPMIAGGLELPYDVAGSAIDDTETIDLAEYRFLDVVAEAKERRHELRFAYRGWNKPEPEMRERVHPLCVRRFDRSWILVAWDVERQDYRTFKFCRMSAVTLTGATFTPPADFNEAEATRGNLGCYTGRERHTVRLALFGVAAMDAIEHAWHDSGSITHRPDGGIELTLELNNLVDVTNRILYWGPDAEALAPAALRDRVIEASIATVARYGVRCAGGPPAHKSAGRRSALP